MTHKNFFDTRLGGLTIATALIAVSYGFATGATAGSAVGIWYTLGSFIAGFAGVLTLFAVFVASE